jgi:UDP:flavonoid glycosyltransferase YjiC (YdhE family)
MRVAVITWDGGSNREPFEVLCRGLLDRNDEVHVLSHDAHRSLYQGLGATFEALPVGEKAPKERPSAVQERKRVMDVWLSQEIAEAVVAMLTEVPFDVAIVDVSLLAAFAGCEAAATPFVVVHHSLPGAAWSGPRREQFEAFVGPANEVRRGLHLPALTDFGEFMARAAAHIVPTAATLDAPIPWDLRLWYVGPLQPVVSDRVLPVLPTRFVLVSFSATWQRQLDHLQNTIEALAPLERAVVVTTGPSVDPSEVTAASNTIVIAELPHRLILHRVDAVVTHAGHGTVLSALTAGVPLVCVPMGRDQHDVTRRVVALGAGLEVDLNTVGYELLPAVRRVLNQPGVAHAAADIALSIAELGGLEETLAIIDRCPRERAPGLPTRRR